MVKKQIMTNMCFGVDPLHCKYLIKIKIIKKSDIFIFSEGLSIERRRISDKLQDRLFDLKLSLIHI